MLRNRQVRPYGKQFSFLKSLIINGTTAEDGHSIMDSDDDRFEFFLILSWLSGNKAESIIRLLNSESP